MPWSRNGIAKKRELQNGVPLVVTTASPEINHLIEVTCPECHGSGIMHCCEGLFAQGEGVP
jgi:hypothetical protein